MNLNYTCICHYCGVIYGSNPSTSKYCCKQHNSLFAANGSNIDHTVLNSNNSYVSYYNELLRLYEILGDGETWTDGYTYPKIAYQFLYKGPLPEADELLLVSGFLIKRIKPYRSVELFCFKPMQTLTKREKASCQITFPNIFILKEHY